MKHRDRDGVAADQGTTGRTVVGLFARRRDAEAAIRDLKTAGFSDAQIGVALQGQGEREELLDPPGSREAEGAAAGAVSGGVVGGLIGLLGSLLIPGVGPIVVGGVLASTLTGAGIGAATGGIIGALTGLGVPETDARHFDQGLRLGSTLVTVDAGARTPEALVILDGHGMDFGPSGTERFAAFDLAAGTAGDPTMAGLDAGFEPSHLRHRERERRARQDLAYAGPERRMAAHESS